MQVVKTKTKTTAITKSESVFLVKNLFRASFSSIAYVRGIFEDECFEEKRIGRTKYKKLSDCTNEEVSDTTNEEVKRFTDWLEKGVFDALVKEYLEVVLLEIYDGEDANKLLECFSFGVSYSDAGATFSLGDGSSTGATSTPAEAKADIKGCTSSVIKKLIEISGKLKPLPDKRIISMKLLYTPKTPADYEPPMFRKASSRDTAWFEQKPDRVSLDPKVVTPFHNVSLSIRSAHIIDKGMYPLAEAIKKHEAADKKREEEKKKRELEEKRIAAERAAIKKRELEEKRISERAAIKKREQAEKKREAEAAQLAAELAATKKAEEAKKREAEKKRIADERAALLQLEQAEKIRKAEEELISKGKRTPKNKLMNKRKKPAPTNKKAGGKPSGGKIVKAKKNLSPRTPTRRSTRNKTTVFVRDVDSTRNSNSSGSSESNMSLDGSPSVYTMSNTTRKTSEVHDKVHQDY